MWSRAVTTIEAGTLPRLKERYLNVLRPSSKRSSAWPTSCRSRVSRRSCSTAASAGHPAAVPHRGRPARPRADHRPKDGGDEAKQSIAGFKLREGQAIGVKVTLRGTAPGSSSTGWSLSPSAIRDFRGLSPRSFDGHGNYTFGVTEQLIFPEIDYDRIDTVRAWTSRL